jgi:hypothetical protein
MALDADPEVVGVAAQPMWLHWATGSGRSVRHAPDYFARRADGTGVVIDVRAGQRIGDQDAAVFAATAQVCAQVGWDYQRAGGARPVQAANLLAYAQAVTVAPLSRARATVFCVCRSAVDRYWSPAAKRRPGAGVLPRPVVGAEREHAGVSGDRVTDRGQA